MKSTYNSDRVRVMHGAPGGASFAKTTGHNRKIERSYDRRAKEYNAMIAGMKDTAGYKKPGSRKKIH